VSRRLPRRGTPSAPCRGGVLARARRGSIEPSGTVRGCASWHAAAIMDIGSPLEHAESGNRKEAVEESSSGVRMHHVNFVPFFQGGLFEIPGVDDSFV
jgi:hypothetical protein